MHNRKRNGTLMFLRNYVQKLSWKKADRIKASIHGSPGIFSPIQLCLGDCEHHCARIQNHSRSLFSRTAYKQTEKSYRPTRHCEHILLCSSLTLNGHTAGTSVLPPTTHTHTLKVMVVSSIFNRRTITWATWGPERSTQSLPIQGTAASDMEIDRGSIVTSVVRVRGLLGGTFTRRESNMSMKDF